MKSPRGGEGEQKAWRTPGLEVRGMEGIGGMRRKSEEPKEMSAGWELGCRGMIKETDSQSGAWGSWRPSKEDCCRRSGKRSQEVLRPRWAFFPVHGIPWGWFRSRTLQKTPDSAFQNQCLRVVLTWASPEHTLRGWLLKKKRWSSYSQRCWVSGIQGRCRAGERLWGFKELRVVSG